MNTTPTARRERITIELHGEHAFAQAAERLAGDVDGVQIDWRVANGANATFATPSDYIRLRPCALPANWLARFLSVIEAIDGQQLIAPFCELPALRPVRAGRSLMADSDDALDALCHAFGAQALFECDADAIDAAPLLFIPAGHTQNQLAGSGRHLLLFGGMFVAKQRGRVHLDGGLSAIVKPWFALCDRIAAGTAAGKPSSLLGDARPRLLHVLHDWGGGVARFAQDFAASDAQYRHLWLRPSGVHGEKLFGARVELFDPTDQLLLADCPVSPAIGAITPHSAAYTAELTRIVDAYQVKQMLVSSLIGQSLDALRTGLPTAYVFHDFFPLWPKLHCDFGNLNRRFDAAELAQDAANSPPFAKQLPATWHALRMQFEAALIGANAQIFMPSQSVRAALGRIAPDLAALATHVIGHGLAPLGAVPTPALLRSAQLTKLHVLVPGRLAGGKGADLLLASLPGLLAHANLTLLGAGDAVQPFLARGGVDVICDYQLADLPRLIGELAPDLALLPRTVAETFSYSLSELQALGVPVLATQLGALAERILDCETGFLCAPEPQALIAAVARLAAERSQLQAVRAHLQQLGQPTPAAQAARYAAAFARATNAGAATPLSPASAQSLFSRLGSRSLQARTALGLAQSHINTLETSLVTTQTKLKAAEAENIRRGNWGRTLSDELAERSRWAQSLTVEIADLRTQITHAQAAYSAQIEHLESVLADERALALAQTERAALAAAAVAAHRDTLTRELEGANAQIAALLASSSWRLTRPLRAAARALSSAKSSMRFHAQRTKTLIARGMTSLRTRGVTATLARGLGRGHASACMPMALALPEVPVQFAAYDLLGTIANADDAARIDVSIVIPVYNKFRYTDTCLRALSASRSQLHVEVIVVDDCSTDETWENLARIGGIRAVQNPQNTGFIGACNAGALAARGEYLVFLNNDTAVQPHWLDALIATFSARPDAGLVGAKLVYPDGRLQESGGIIFRDGSGWNYGRFDAPNDPRFNFVREVDYCSGAAIAIRRTLFARFGGFDTLYAPAYYEDTDLAFKVRDAGLKCYVQPASVVVHFEGISSGTDLNSGIKRYQVLNQAKFFARWESQLQSHPQPPPKDAILRSCQHRAKRHILVIDAVTPMPDQDSGSLRMVNLLRILLDADCAVTFFCEGRHYHQGYAEQLQALGVQVLYHPYLSAEPAWLREHGGNFDAVLLSRHYIAAPLLGLVREYCRRARVIFDTVDLHFLREQRQAELNGDAALARAAEKTKLDELAVINSCDLTLVVSPIEAELLRTLTPAAKVEVLSNIHQVPGRAADFSEREGLLFVGGFQHPPNVDAVLWFVHDVLPLCLAQAPDLILHLVGSKTPPEITALAGPNVIVHGFVADITPLLTSCRLSVAPLRYGAGVKGKVNMAMAHGLPVVATPCAVEGMHCTPGLDVLVGESPAEFAQQLLDGYRDAAQWQQLSEGGLDNVRTHFSFAAAKTVVTRVFGI